MGALEILAQLLAITNTLAPTIAALRSDVRNEHPDLSDDQIDELATTTAQNTRDVAGPDRQ